MELGSAEHKQLLWQMIKKTAFKTFCSERLLVLF